MIICGSCRDAQSGRLNQSEIGLFRSTGLIEYISFHCLSLLLQNNELPENE